MFFVYSGYVSSDRCDCSEGPIYTIKVFPCERDVLNYKKEFASCIHEECSNVIFRAFKGKELRLKPEEIVLEWKLEEL